MPETGRPLNAICVGAQQGANRLSAGKHEESYLTEPGALKDERLLGLINEKLDGLSEERG